ncbi:MAG: hypothetical protein ACK2T2_06270 [Anaerolineales bacterium]
MDEQTAPLRRKEKEQAASGRPYSRVLAALVLVPAVPMLLLSVGTLLLFYLAPVRFGDLLARLPGESFIRTALIFAPATLFAVVVLALLYAVEKPAGAQDEPAQPARKAAVATRAMVMRPAARLALAIAVPLWLFALGLWSLSFISPGRFDRLLSPLPGDSYLRPLIPYAPWVLFLIVIAAASFAFAPQRAEDEAGVASRRPARGAAQLLRPAVSAVLISSLPALLGSLAALALYWLRPESFARMLERLPFDTLVRAAMVFVPPTSFVVVVLASMYLLGTSRLRRIPTSEITPSRAFAPSLRSNLGMLVLTAGLSLSAALGLGLLGALIYLILR